jgi:hypothetical protein
MDHLERPWPVLKGKEQLVKGCFTVKSKRSFIEVDATEKTQE